MMKKMLFLMLFLLILGAANLNSQVRIGGNGQPHGAAVLDLNANNDAVPTGNKGGLALPRVNLGALSGTNANLNGSAPITGMLVYNTNTTLGAGIYFWDGSNWVIISGDGVIGNEVLDATVGGGLIRAGLGTTANPYTLGVARRGIDTSMMAGPEGETTFMYWTQNRWRIVQWALAQTHWFNVPAASKRGDTILLADQTGCHWHSMITRVLAPSNADISWWFNSNISNAVVVKNNSAWDNWIGVEWKCLKVLD